MAVFRCLPIDLASGLGGWLGTAIGPRLGISRRALKNLGLALPQNSDAQNRKILRGMWDNLGRSMAEYPHLDRICAARSGRVEIVNGDGVGAMLADGKPGIVFGGHFANWEIGPATVHRLMGASLMSVYRPANNPWVNSLQRRRLRSRRAVAKGARGGRDVLLHLRRGGHVGLLVDQKQNDGVAAPFLGRLAMTAPGVARLGRHFDCPVVPIRTERLAGAHFRFTVLAPLDIPHTGDGAADDLETMTRVNRVIGEWVLARPEQWLWLH
ncbi:MAG: lysophospholipid acyltransferase family protein, partial [Stellaceae bacterium]